MTEAPRGAFFIPKAADRTATPNRPTAAGLGRETKEKSEERDMKKEDLTAMGLSEEHAGKVLAAYTEEMKGFVPRSRLDEETAKSAGLTTQLADRDKDIAQLQKDAGKGTDLEKQLTDLQEKYKTDTESLQKQLSDQKLDSALDAAIHGAKGRNPKAIKALLNREALKIKDDGTLEGLDLEALKKSDAYLFEVEVRKDEGTGAYGGSSGAGNVAISQESFRQNINNVAWMQANIDAVTTGLANGSLTKG